MPFIHFSNLNAQTLYASISFDNNWVDDETKYDHVWKINELTFGYTTDTLQIPLSSTFFDSISYRHDTTIEDFDKSIARFKPNHHYLIRFVPCTDYDIIRADTSVVQHYRVSYDLLYPQNSDTIFGVGGIERTTALHEGNQSVNISARISGMCSNSRREIGFVSKEEMTKRNQALKANGLTGRQTILFQFLEDECLRLVYNASLMQFEVQLIH